MRYTMHEETKEEEEAYLYYVKLIVQEYAT